MQISIKKVFLSRNDFSELGAKTVYITYYVLLIFSTQENKK